MLQKLRSTTTHTHRERERQTLYRRPKHQPNTEKIEKEEEESEKNPPRFQVDLQQYNWITCNLHIIFCL